MIVKTGNKLQIKGNVQVIDQIPVDNWLTVFDEKKEDFYLERQPEFEIPNKIYGNAKALAKRYVNTFNNRKGRPLGILLAGAKGTGKTLQAKLTCEEALLPVIIINQKHIGEKFYAFLASITQKCIIFIDEFEKIYREQEDQETFLSILEGTLSTDKMFIFTVNNKEISTFLLNRPGRIFYSKDYNNMDRDTVQEVIDDRLENKELEDGLWTVINLMGQVSIDIVISLIEEMNMYDEPAKVVADNLNIEIEATTFDVALIRADGVSFHTTVNFNPLERSYFWFGYHDHISDTSQWFSADKSEYGLSVDRDSFVFSKGREQLIFTPASVGKKFSFLDIDD